LNLPRAAVNDRCASWDLTGKRAICASKALLLPEALIDQPLQPRPVDHIVSEFFAGKHAESGAAGVCGHFRRFVQRQIGILADHRHHHAYHHLQAPQSSGLFHAFLVFCAWWVRALAVHTAPVFCELDDDEELGDAHYWLRKSKSPPCASAKRRDKGGAPAAVQTRQRDGNCRKLLSGSSTEDPCQNRLAPRLNQSLNPSQTKSSSRFLTASRKTKK